MKKLKKKLKLRNFKKIFKITKFEIHLKKKKIEILQVVELLIA